MKLNKFGKVQISISVTPKQLEDIDDFCDRYDILRATFIREVSLSHVDDDFMPTMLEKFQRKGTHGVHKKKGGKKDE